MAPMAASTVLRCCVCSKLWKIFEEFDTDNDRRVNLDEFTKGVRKLGVRIKKKDALDVFNRIDRNGGGEILFDGASPIPSLHPLCTATVTHACLRRHRDHQRMVCRASR